MADKEGEHYFNKKIYDSVNTDELMEAKTVNITVSINGEMFSFNINRDRIFTDGEISTYEIIPAAIRTQVVFQLKKRKKDGMGSSSLLFKDIVKITYKKKAIYSR